MFSGVSLFEEVVPLYMCDIRTKFPQPEVLHLSFNSKRHLKRLTKPLEWDFRQKVFLENHRSMYMGFSAQLQGGWLSSKECEGWSGLCPLGKCLFNQDRTKGPG